MAAAESCKKGNEHFRLGELREAIACYTTAIELLPDKPIYRVNRAAAYVGLKQFHAARLDVRGALELDPRLDKARYYLAVCCVAFGELDKASEELADLKQNEEAAKLLQTVQEQSRLLAQARRAMQQERYADAAQLIRGILEVQPNSLAAKLMLAEALIGNKQAKDALRLCNAVYQSQDGKTSEVLRLRGTALYYMDQFEDARANLERAVKMDANNAAAAATLQRMALLMQKMLAGNGAFRRRQYADAIKLYTEALRVDPCHDRLNAALYNKRAAAHEAGGDFDGALADWRECLRIRPDYGPKVHSCMGDAYAHMKMFDRARECYEAALKLAPHYSDIRRKLDELIRYLRRRERKTYYELLGVDRGADERTIAKAYRQLALIHHPDKNGETPEARAKAEDKFKELLNAYDTLRDPVKRSVYDAGLDAHGDDD